MCGVSGCPQVVQIMSTEIKQNVVTFCSHSHQVPPGQRPHRGVLAAHLFLFWWQPTLKRNHTQFAELYNVGERKITRRSLDSATDVAMNHFMRRSFNLRCHVTDTQTQWRQRISASRGGEKNHSPASINPNYTDHHVSIVPLRPLCICK